MRRASTLVLAIITTSFLVSGCSYKFCDIGPVCTAQHIFVPKAITIEAGTTDEKLDIRPLEAKFDSAYIEFAGRRTSLELDIADAFTHDDLGTYVFTPRKRTHTVKFGNARLVPSPLYPHDQVPAPINARLCLRDINYYYSGTTTNVPVKSDGAYFQIDGDTTKGCLTFPAEKLGAWIDCGDGCPPDGITP